MQGTHRMKLQLWRKFTDGELRDRGHELSEVIQEYAEVELQKAETSKQYAEELKELRESGNRLAREIHDQGSIQSIECEVTYHQPHVGAKTIVRLDSGEIVREEQMTPNELQEILFEESRPDDQVKAEAKGA